MNRRRSRAQLVGFTLSALAFAIGSERLQAAEADTTAHVQVVGQAASIDNALNAQRSSDSIKSVAHADGVAQLPAQTAAEAVQRLPGRSVQRGPGTARLVAGR
ncbi:TonB-dependent receptor, partial [Pseudomonas syringae]